ncbi:hypothetical protein K4W91_07100 [Pseudomonas aeruginosa]|uniref:hypothetical protein n=1 Tax=Pseudomonas aeruginosa TaxID=287 RepID=UPI000FD5B00D|nr:hypothetical protein [Pseudomonas aeruginosa]MCD2821496.1 hypothetical protein [Pseudomonas aeruginosa]MCD2827782.1 hypothetical protein [Pseudomonas aeruginosa]RUI07188.1 hypothetical protein IPC449_11370 [Pseudomonas aeruginosa]HCF4144105.1 hypothetical protein [Pseudomonas aeruginosa]
MKLLLKPLLQQGITPDRERLSDVQVRGSVFILDGVEYDFGRMQPGGYLLPEAYHGTPFIDIRFVDGDRLYLHYIHQVTSEVMMQFPREVESIPVDQDGKVEVAFSYEHPMG